MVKVVRIGPNPAFKPAKGQEGTWAAIKSQPARNMAYVSAMENVKLSGGMYAILPDATAEVATATAIRMPEDMTRDELILTAMQLGIDMTKKQMKKADLVKSVRLAIEQVQLLDDGEDSLDAE